MSCGEDEERGQMPSPQDRRRLALLELQNRAARILTFSNYDVRSTVLLDELGWERLEYVRLKQLAVTMYKIHNNLYPFYLRRIRCTFTQS